MIFLPPKLNLVTLSSCRYIWNKLKYTRLKHSGNEFLYPRIPLKKESAYQIDLKLFYFTELYIEVEV